MPEDAFNTGIGGGDELSAEEAERLLAWYRDEHGAGDPDIARFAPFLIDHRPRALKRYRRHAEAAAATGLPALAVPLLYGYVYLLFGYERGVLYELIAARRWGATKNEALDVIELAVLDGGAVAADTACAADDFLRTWPADESRAENPWPADWPQTAAVLELTDSPYTAWLEAEAPATAHTYSSRFAGAAADFSLPAAFIPLMRLTFAAVTGRDQAARAAVEEARRLGCPRQSVTSTLVWASFGGRQEDLDAVVRTVRPILDSWPTA